MEFCEPIYIYNSLFPQFLSALAHFPYIPFFYLLKTHNVSTKKIVISQISTQLVTMSGHLILNPYKYLIPQLSSCLILYWIYLYCNYKTSAVNKLTKNILLFSIVEFLFCIIVLGLYSAIFINFLLFSYLAYTNNLCNLLSVSNKKILGYLYATSFILLGLEIWLCNYVLFNYPTIPLHLVFDILFWQINSNLTLLFL